jgi:hypothetical protein
VLVVRNIDSSRAPVVHDYNPSYSGGSKLGRAKFVRPYLEKTYHKKGLVEWLKFNPQYYKKKKKKKKEK